MRVAHTVAAIVIVSTGLLGLQSDPPRATPAAPARVPLTLLYDILPSRNAVDRVTAIGARTFYLVYQGCDPQCATTGIINPEAVVNAIEAETKGRAPLFGMLDFEDPFSDNLQKGPDSPEGARAIETMIRTIRAVKARFPDTKWTYYGVPWLPYWLDKNGWFTATADAKRAALERATATYAALVRELDWVSPTVYPKYDPVVFPEDQRNTIVHEGRAWRTAQVGLAALMANGKPVIPTLSPYWTPGGRARFCRVISRSEFLDDQVAPCVEAGATGIALWTAIDHFIGISTDCTGRPFTNEKNFGPAEWRAAFVADYLDNQVPADWCDPELKQLLLRRASDTIASALQNTREWEATLSKSPK